MKVLKKAIIPPITCQYCHSIFRPNWKDMQRGTHYFVKEMVHCPVCGGINHITFDESGV